jgi:hypothetical protein
LLGQALAGLKSHQLQKVIQSTKAFSTLVALEQRTSRLLLMLNLMPFLMERKLEMDPIIKHFSNLIGTLLVEITT